MKKKCSQLENFPSVHWVTEGKVHGLQLGPQSHDAVRTSPRHWMRLRQMLQETKPQRLLVFLWMWRGKPLNLMQHIPIVSAIRIFSTKVFCLSSMATPTRRTAAKALSTIPFLRTATCQPTTSARRSQNAAANADTQSLENAMLSTCVRVFLLNNHFWISYILFRRSGCKRINLSRWRSWTGSS